MESRKDLIINISFINKIYNGWIYADLIPKKYNISDLNTQSNGIGIFVKLDNDIEFSELESTMTKKITRAKYTSM